MVDAKKIKNRLSANLKRELQDLARREGRTLSQFVKCSFASGLELYRKEGVKYFQRLLTRQKKDSSE